MSNLDSSRPTSSEPTVERWRTSRPERRKPISIKMAKPRSKELTRREKQVLEAMAEGLSNKLIADKLDMSDHTAKFHVANVCWKLDCDTRTQAVAKAIRAGLV